MENIKQLDDRSSLKNQIDFSAIEEWFGYINNAITSVYNRPNNRK